eukprot:392206-Rhodomonas_salina.1
MAEMELESARNWGGSNPKLRGWSNWGWSNSHSYISIQVRSGVRSVLGVAWGEGSYEGKLPYPPTAPLRDVRYSHSRYNSTRRRDGTTSDGNSNFRSPRHESRDRVAAYPMAVRWYPVPAYA